MKKIGFTTVVISLSALLSVASVAAPFDACPSEAFLVQDTVARIYGVNLATGFYQEHADDMGTTGKVNALGFSVHDNYLYAWGYEFNSLVRINNAFSIEPLPNNGLPDTNFYVGDVSLSEQAYYMYRRGESYGLYRVSLVEQAETYMSAERIIDGAALNLRIYDMAFHPQNNDLYSVDSRGALLRINPVTGNHVQVSNVGQSGTFGAVYFDNEGFLYISRNADGHIFRIDTSQPEPEAEFFAFGPSSGNNDGARCALAPIVSEQDTIDFGSAPESYGSTIEANGARHEMSDTLYLGGASGNDDGVDFITGFESGLNTLLVVNTVGSGYANAWADWNQNGSFEDDEQFLEGHYMTDGSNRVLVDVPVDAQEGATWGRFRFSSTQALGPNGGVSDGEVEDYPVNVTSTGTRVESYPDSQGFVTLAFEDNWPVVGDYDMNDVVVAFQTHQFVNENNEVIRYDIKGRLLAVGASYHNGFAVQLDGIATENIDEALIRFSINDQESVQQVLEQNNSNDDAVLIVTEDVWRQVSVSESCAYYRTQTGCEEIQRFEFSVAIPLKTPVPQALAPSRVLNPFIFATPGTYHGDGFESHPGRGLEIHLKNKPPSARFNPAFLGMADDESSPEDELWFVNVNSMPWAIELPVLWHHPQERVDILEAYPQFPAFVASQGVENTTWYQSAQAISDRIIVNQ